MFDANKSKLVENDNYIKEIKEQQDILYKLKRQVSDQRREYNKLLVSDARADNLTEKLIESAENINNFKPLCFDNYENIYGEKEAILCISDIHYGLVCENIWNKYNTDIAKYRLEILTKKVIEHLKTHTISKLHIILLGDLAHGAIHTSVRVASEEDTCDQLIQISELIAEVVAELSRYVNEVKVYSTYGNHLRTIQNKNDSIHSDNMEKIVPWWLRQRFQNCEKIEVIDSEFYEFIKFNVLGYNILVTHGDLDNFRNLGVTMNTLFSKVYGETIDYTLSGDKHHLEEFEQFGIESILIPSMCGTDQYANDKRLYSKPMQTLLIFNEEDGRVDTCNIKFNK